MEEWRGRVGVQQSERREARGDRVKFKIVRAQKFGVLLLYLWVLVYWGVWCCLFSGVKSVPNSARVSV